MYIVRLFLILLLFTTPLFSKAILDGSTTTYDNFQIHYLQDITDKLTIEEVQNTPFVKTTSNSFTFGYIDTPIWFKIEIENLSNQKEYVLALSEALWKNFDLYYQKDGVWVKEKNGLDIPLIDRGIKDAVPAFAITLQKNSVATFYIKGQTISGQLGKLEIYTDNAYFNPTRTTLLKLYIAFALLLGGIILVNLYSLIITRDIAYVYYIAYIIATIVFSSIQSGSYLILGFSGWNEGLHVVGALVILTLLLFTDTFLKFKNEFPKVHKFFMLSIGLLLLFIVLISNNVPYVSHIFNLYSILFFSVLFYALIKTFLKGYIDVRFYLLALIIYLPLMGLMIATFNAFLPYHDISRHAFLLGSFIEILLFTLILLKRYSTINLEKLKIQEELLYEKSKNEEYLALEIEKRTEELQLLASTDSLTGLYNRRYFSEIAQSLLELAKREKTELSVIMMDIDDFKCVNDTYGHAVGDKVITDTTKILKECTRESDIVSRWGGEEFLVLLPQTDMEGALVIAKKVEKAIQNKVINLHNNQKVTFTLSMGISLVHTKNDLTLEASINRADKALYEAKESGKNRICQKLP